MGNNTAMPQDSNKTTMQLIPAKESIVTEITSLTTHLLNSNTSLLEVFSEYESLVIKWGTDTITATNYSVIIPAGQIRHLAVPSGITNVMVAKLSDFSAPTTLYLLEF